MSSIQPLSSFPRGSRVKIMKLCNCPRARGRLCAMGLTPGTIVEVNSNGAGPCRLKVRGSDLVLGNRMAGRIFGRPAGDNEQSAESETCHCACR